jgi:DNA-binding CsgD family transcriptional regulator
VTAASTHAGLLERDDALGRVAHATDEVARTGCGRVLVVEGPPGIGKSRLLREVCERASAAGKRILSASGAESESSLAFGVVRQLFAPLVDDESSRLGPSQGAAALARPAIDPTMKRSVTDVDLDAVMYGLLSLCIPLAGEKGLLLSVDDAHWVDASSLQWIGYLARRVSELPVLIVLTARSPERQASSRGMLLNLTAQAETMRLLPLSEQATATLLRRSLGPSLADDVCRACHVATGGNPFYLHELLAARGEALLAADRTAIEMMAPTRVVHSVIARLAALGSDAERLARAVAVLGARVELRHAALLADLDPADAETLADRLAAASILRDERPPKFEHPIVQAAVLEQLPEGARALLHHRAARILHARGSNPAVVGVKLLRTQPHADEWTVARLREAANDARSCGDAPAAAAYLDRALREPPAPTDRGAVLLESGTVKRQLFDRSAVRHLRAALELADDRAARVRIAFELIPALSQPGDLDEALGVIADVLPALRHSPDLSALLEANRVALASLHLVSRPPDTSPALRLLERLDVDDRSARVLRGVLASDAVYRGRPAAEVRAWLDAALAVDPEGLAWDPNVATSVAFTAMTCERHDGAERLLAAALRRARRRRSAPAAAHVLSFRSHLHLRLGRVADAEADARAALHAPGLVKIAPLPVDVLLERDEPEEALALLRRSGAAGALPAWLPSLIGLARRIPVWIALSRLDMALADLSEAQRLAATTGFADSVATPWRAQGALACLAAGQAQRARTLADEHLGLARTFGLPGAVGSALRVAGTVHAGEQGLELLQDAADTLAGTPMRLEHAKALAALGAAQRRAGHRTKARRTLTLALDLADACGALAVARQARAELLIAGARPRRNRLHGPAALTASQLRVATLAANGATNLEIAQALFLTPKTIERHLTNAYHKLAISSRKELAPVLAGDGRLSGQRR